MERGRIFYLGRDSSRGKYIVQKVKEEEIVTARVNTVLCQFKQLEEATDHAALRTLGSGMKEELLLCVA